ncbi:hypothetical protein ACEPAF_196 [Sanghuangporus sanghuang]
MSAEPETLPVPSYSSESDTSSDREGLTDQGGLPEPDVPTEPGEPNLPLPEEPQKPPKKKRARGTLVRNNFDEIVATFVVEGSLMIFRAGVNRGLQPFTSKKAKLTYEYRADLKGSHTINGTIGTLDFDLCFDNGPHITGSINHPTPSNECEIHGNGDWKAF